MATATQAAVPSVVSGVPVPGHDAKPVDYNYAAPVSPTKSDDTPPQHMHAVVNLSPPGTGQQDSQADAPQPHLPPQIQYPGLYTPPGVSQGHPYSPAVASRPPPVGASPPSMGVPPPPVGAAPPQIYGGPQAPAVQSFPTV